MLKRHKLRLGSPMANLLASQMASLMVSLTQESLTKRNLMIKIRTRGNLMARNQRQVLARMRNLMTANHLKMVRWYLLQ